ncbi:MAG: c-type cytochrome biogenesis protein CcmI [Mesorhizobium sp.]|nr:c-type cytochrome biogenesis protein CcmI [Mesorhizobium sp.]
MLFWIAAAAMTAVACLAILAPMLRRQTATPVGTHDVEVYRDQLSELDRDTARGLIAAGEADQARAEIARRLLKASSASAAPVQPAQSGRAVRYSAMVAVLAVPLVSWGLYGAIGSPDMPGQPLGERLARNPADSTIDELIARAERHLVENPDDARGWDVLGPIYMRQSRFAEAASAFGNAIRLAGSTALRQTGLGEALASAANGLVTADARSAFERALGHEPDNAKARFFLATALAQDGRLDDARKGWQALKEKLDAGSPWHGPVDQAIAAVDRELASPGTAQAAPGPAEPAAPGPQAADIAAAQDMTATERTAMVEGMVANLDARLRDNPADVEGWRRLIRSYVVLGRNDDARAALDRAVLGLGADAEAVKGVSEFAAGLGIKAVE